MNLKSSPNYKVPLLPGRDASGDYIRLIPQKEKEKPFQKYTSDTDKAINFKIVRICGSDY